MNDDDPILDSFIEQARLFPLPNLVLFPHIDQPLHIFEPRYRQLTADALADDRLIALALVTEGSKVDLAGSPPIHPGVCVGRIIAEKMMDDGEYLLVLRGLARGRIVEEIAGDEPYRTARVQVLQDAITLPPADVLAVRRRFASLILPSVSNPNQRKELQELFSKEIPLGMLCDFLAYKLHLPFARKQQLLEEPDVATRARILLEELSRSLPPGPPEGRKFPPDFSLN